MDAIWYIINSRRVSEVSLRDAARTIPVTVHQGFIGPDIYREKYTSRLGLYSVISREKHVFGGIERESSQRLRLGFGHIIKNTRWATGLIRARCIVL